MELKDMRYTDGWMDTRPPRTGIIYDRTIYTGRFHNHQRGRHLIGGLRPHRKGPVRMLLILCSLESNRREAAR